MLTMNASTISTDLNLRTMTCSARNLRCKRSRFASEAVSGKKMAVMASNVVNRKADRFLTKCNVWTTGSRPHRVCARFLWKLESVSDWSWM